MNEIANLKAEIEAIRRELDKAAVSDRDDGKIYSLSLEMDALIEKYLSLYASE